MILCHHFIIQITWLKIPMISLGFIWWNIYFRQCATSHHILNIIINRGQKRSIVRQKVLPMRTSGEIGESSFGENFTHMVQSLSARGTVPSTSGLVHTPMASTVVYNRYSGRFSCTLNLGGIGESPIRDQGSLKLDGSLYVSDQHV